MSRVRVFIDTNILIDVCLSLAFNCYGAKPARRYADESCRLFELLVQSEQTGHILSHVMSEARNICVKITYSDFIRLGLPISRHNFLSAKNLLREILEEVSAPMLLLKPNHKEFKDNRQSVESMCKDLKNKHESESNCHSRQLVRFMEKFPNSDDVIILAQLITFK